MDILIRGGRVFNGSEQGESRIADVAIKDGKVIAISAGGLQAGSETTVINADGKWVTPGFIDIHTHYDAEVVAAPGLPESVRHGVTTCVIGSCSISMIWSGAENASDMFTRVESIPRQHVLPLLQEKKTWSDAASFVDAMNAAPLGPNLASYAGHSDLRVSVLGLDKAVDGTYRPTEAEMQEMEKRLEEGLDAGLLGLSSMTNPWDKLDGDRHRSAALPSVYASWKEYRRLHRLLRRRDAILQSAPNLVTRFNAAFFLFTSAGLFMRRKLRTTLITLMDIKADRMIAKLVTHVANFFNSFLGADFRWQALPIPFQVYSDGMDFVVFEEFPAGEAALHLTQDVDRKKLYQDPAYREEFKKDYKKKFAPKVWHRDFGDAHIIDAPDESLVGKSVAEIAAARGQHEVDLFLDLLIEHGDNIRWRTLIGNDRPDQLKRIVQERCAIVGFSDAGAHIRNMAFYNFPLHMLKFATGPDAIMSPEKAVWRLTGEVADWLDIDAGRLTEGARADIAIIDPEALARTDLLAYAEAPFDALGDREPRISRLVNRHVGVVQSVIINGKLAIDEGEPCSALGKEKGCGQFLKGLRSKG